MDDGSGKLPDATRKLNEPVFFCPGAAEAIEVSSFTRENLKKRS
jgi:hypothetical protein